VPENHLLAVGEGLVGAEHDLPIGGVERRPLGLSAGLDGVGDLGDRLGLVTGGLLGGDPAQGHEQVGAESLVGAGTPAERPEHPLERLVDEVVGVAAPAVGRRQAAGGGRVAHVELGRGRRVALARVGQQVEITRCGIGHRSAGSQRT
jgi:hypothetical protein